MRTQRCLTLALLIAAAAANAPAARAFGLFPKYVPVLKPKIVPTTKVRRREGVGHGPHASHGPQRRRRRQQPPSPFPPPPLPAAQVTPKVIPVPKVVPGIKVLPRLVPTLEFKQIPGA